MTLGEYLISARSERGVSQRELAEKCGVSSAEISRVESGKRQKPSPTILKAVADALVISYPTLMALAGYSQETHEAEQTFEQVFRDENGEIVDVVRGVREMLSKDAAWANIAYRVSHELSDRDRQILMDMANVYLERRRAEKAQEEKRP